MSARLRRPAVLWLVLVALGCAALAALTYRVFVTTTRGQLVDGAAFEGAGIGRDRIIDQLRGLLDVVSVLSLAAATVTVGAIAVLRRRPGIAVLAVALVAGTNVSTYVLKHRLLHRPDLGVPGPSPALSNSLPSGHTTVAMSVAVAFVLVVPPRVRGLAALLGAAYGAATGVATLSAGWHRPSDAVAGALVVGAWAAGLGAVAAAVGPPVDPGARDRTAREAHPVTSAVLLSGSAVLLAIGALALALTTRAADEDLSRLRLFVAYVGGAAAISGTALAVLAALLVVVHRVVPSPEPPPAPEDPVATAGTPARVLRFPGPAA